MKKNSFKDKLHDVVYEKMKYSVEKHSQIVAQLRVLTDKHGNLLFRTILLFNATMTRKWCYLWMGLYEWLARIPICAFYSSSDKPNTDYNKALKIIFDNKDDLKPLYYEKERNYELIRRTNNVSDRSAKVVCNLVYYDGKHTLVGEGILHGKITDEPRGENGFGFDSIFELENGKTLAEISSEEKNKLSARCLAASDLVKKIKSISI